MNRDTHAAPQPRRMREVARGCREISVKVAYVHFRARCPKDCGDCRLCNLWICGRCGGVEGTLTKAGCPGFELTQEERDLVFEGWLSARDVQALRVAAEQRQDFGTRG